MDDGERLVLLDLADTPQATPRLPVAEAAEVWRSATGQPSASLATNWEEVAATMSHGRVSAIQILDSLRGAGVIEESDGANSVRIKPWQRRRTADEQSTPATV
jgi:hypothetical protein